MEAGTTYFQIYDWSKHSVDNFKKQRTASSHNRRSLTSFANCAVQELVSLFGIVPGPKTNGRTV